jgi:UDP-2-acetamido-3-amino-2,3-dideoxy-glucuronate N-acetyltransferase
VFTNDLNPRAVTPEGRLKSPADWHAVGVTVLEGGSVGARAVCVAPVTIGRWAMVAAGAVVTRDVPDFALVLGVPARQVGWVGRAGVRVVEEGEGDEAGRGSGRFVCPETGAVYLEKDGVLSEIDAP